MLIQKNDNYKLISFPDNSSQIGQIIRQTLNDGQMSALSLQLLFSSDRLNQAEHINELKKEHTVIVTRYSYSAIAYGTARGLNKQLMSLLEENMPQPDLKIFLQIPVNISINRAKNPDFLERDRALLKKVVKEYEFILSDEKDWHIIDATKSITSVFDQVQEIIWNYIQNKQ